MVALYSNVHGTIYIPVYMNCVCCTTLRETVHMRYYTVILRYIHCIQFARLYVTWSDKKDFRLSNFVGIYLLETFTEDKRAKAEATWTECPKPEGKLEQINFPHTCIL